MHLLNDDHDGCFEPLSGTPRARLRKPWASLGTPAAVGELIWLIDFVCLVAVVPLCMAAMAWLLGLLDGAATLAAPAGSSLEHLESGFDNAFGPIGVAVALVTPFILHDGSFAGSAALGQIGRIAGSHALRFGAFVCGVLLLGAASDFWDGYEAAAMGVWFGAAFVSTLAARLALVRLLQAWRRQGALTEVVAVVGAGPVADRLVGQLRLSRPDNIEVLGIFDDSAAAVSSGQTMAVGSIARLLELGKTGQIDWIVLTLPPNARLLLQATVERLKALSVPIALCPQHIGMPLRQSAVAYVGHGLAVDLLADRPANRWDPWIKAGDAVLPRWIVTLAMLPAAAFMAFSAAPSSAPSSARPARPASAGQTLAPTRRRSPARRLQLRFDDHDLASFTQVAASFGSERFAYVVTPNADHVIRLNEQASFRALYASADFVLLDSRFVSHVMRIGKGITLPVCTGSDLTEKLFTEVIAPGDGVVLIGGTPQQARLLAERYGLRRLAHFNPSMGFIHRQHEVQACLDFVERHSPFRFCLLAVGAPQQEAIAQMLKQRDIARGLTLCIGASINFLTGGERRAPAWLQRCGMEWSYRLMQAPRSMAGRYLVRGPRVFGLLRHADIELRPRVAPVGLLGSTSPGLPAYRASQLGSNRPRASKR
jgi:exopolysaccharide biosynthesis WecB/TagA/CpsF family protein